MSSNLNIKGQIGKTQHRMATLLRYRDNVSVRVSLLVVLSLVLVSIFLVFAIRPTLTKIFELRTEIASSKETLAQLTSKVDALTNVATRWESISANKVYIDNAIPMGPQYRTYNKELSYLAGQWGVDITSMTMGESLVYTKTTEPYIPNLQMEIISIPVTLRVGGDYAKLQNFLRQLLSIDRLIKISDITMTPETVTSDAVQYPLIMSVSGTIYYLGDPTQLSPFVTTEDKAK